jgi:AraC-like DNA-binding protein
LTPHQYLTRHRLARAALMLRRSARSVTEICFEAGFESPGSFSTLFRRHFGLSPREFRQQRSGINPH